MKKLLVVLAAGLLVFGVAGRANAYFAQGDLIRVVYDTTKGVTYEQATDLGSVTSIEANPSTLSDSGYNLESGAGGSKAFSNLSTLNVAYFAVNSTGGVGGLGEFWSSGTTGASETNIGSSNSLGVLQNAGNILAHAYAPSASSGGTANAWYSLTGTYSYYMKMDGNGTAIGSFNQFYFSGPSNGEIALVAGGSVKQDLFDWTNPSTTSTILGSLTLTTALSSAGVISTSATPAVGAVPIPPSVLLFGSGLLGLVGIRRRNLFNF